MQEQEQESEAVLGSSISTGSEDLPIFLITAYAKAEKGNLSKAEQNTLAKMARNFFEDYRSKA